MGFKIHKIPLEIIPQQIIGLEMDANILTIQAQNQVPCIWYSFDPDLKKPKKKLRLTMVVTGYLTSIPHDSRNYGYLGTVQIDSFVWHFFFDREQLDE